MMQIVDEPEILSIDELLAKKLQIPAYQRPYKWTTKNMADLLDDISTVVSSMAKYDEFKYRIGTIILHRDGSNFNIVDGQQRIISLILLKLVLTNGTFNNSLLNKNYTGDKISQKNIFSNYHFIKDWFLLKKSLVANVEKALSEVLEVVVICVDDVSEAFQLFDSQNTRGRALDPHDLLKAYHLREMKESIYDMRHAVTKWEAVDSKEISDLFSLYLFPIKKWTMSEKCYPFSVNEIDIYKGIEDISPYTYAKRASKAAPYFQIDEPFIAGNDFFEMVVHYLNLLKDIKTEINTKRFDSIGSILKWNVNADDEEIKSWAGFRYSKNLFFCAVLCYYDKFKNFDEQSIKKLFSWAFMVRTDMENLGFDTINKYAIGEQDNVKYTNSISMFSKIANARRHSEIANIQLEYRKENKAELDKWDNLYSEIRRLNGYGK